jgi:membrane protease YdiL (CAAX protease family)
VFVERLPVQPWVLAIALLYLVGSLLVTNYAGLAHQGVGFTLLLAFSMLMVGFAEEGMFRGIGLTALRAACRGEGWAALWSTVVFGLVHASNLVDAGPKALAQVLLAAVSGYFFYLIRRRTGGLVVPALLHAFFDFSLVSGGVVDGKGYPGGLVGLLVVLVAAILVVVRRRRIEPAT